MALCMQFVITYINWEEKKAESEKTTEAPDPVTPDILEADDTILDTPTQNPPVEDWINSSDPSCPATISATQSISSFNGSRCASHTSLDCSEKLLEPVLKTSVSKLKLEEAIIKEVSKLKEKENGEISPDDKLKTVKFFSFQERLRIILKENGITSSFRVTSHLDQVPYIQESFLVPVIGTKVDDVYYELQNIGFGKLSGTSISVFSPFLHESCLNDGKVEDNNEETENTINSEECAPTFTAGEPVAPLQLDEKTNDEEGILLKDMSAISQKETPTEQNEILKTSSNCIIFAQVVNDMASKVALTSDCICLIVLASIIAAIGLIENSSVVLVASMLVSPLMSPILGGTFCTVIGKWDLVKEAIFNAILLLLICILTGFICGVPTAFINQNGVNTGTDSWPSAEMTNRGLLRGLWIGAFIAIPSGVGVAVSSLSANISSLVGVAISASLLPPAVNCGMLWASTIVYNFKSPLVNETDLRLTNSTEMLNSSISSPTNLECSSLINNNYKTTYTCNLTNDLAILGTISLLLTFVNIICICLSAVFVFFLKGVTICNRDHHVAKETIFNKPTIAFAREYNKTIKKGRNWELELVAKSLTEKNKVATFDIYENLLKSGHPVAANVVASNIESAVPTDDILHPQYYETLGLHSLFEGRQLRRIVSVEQSEHLPKISSAGRFVVLRQDSKNISDSLKSQPKISKVEAKILNNFLPSKQTVSSYTDKETSESIV
ncbi:DgyrCDS11564 [Dimorphilus gyrociliatus]|uniref:DgyrCDS11564 n=1 Tax=Dimorphilus gyrociliatus TaxID=2664684 RepID=A0A7I8W3Q9_9ANNE|nr:DgyrCDS11564 [Dimorphilus gyrociliatus]